jgi:cytoskeleton protein RodZ
MNSDTTMMKNEPNLNTQDAVEPTDLLPEQTETPISDVPERNLAQLRELKRMSVGDVAYALKVSPRVVTSLEASDWSALPGRTFTVGMLRAYGRLLDTPVDALIAQVPGGQPAMKKNITQSEPTRKAAPATRRDGESKRQEKRMLKTGLVMIVLALVLAYAVPSSIWQPLLTAAQTTAERWVRPDVVQTPAVATPADPAPPLNATPSTATTEPVAVAQVQTSPGTLELKFSAPAWVEVRDYTGRIIYSQLNAAGSAQMITGAAPLDVLIGNARQVQVRWRDEPVKLEKLSADDVARQVLR